jgi:hypothetical protein
MWLWLSLFVIIIENINIYFILRRIPFYVVSGIEMSNFTTQLNQWRHLEGGNRSIFLGLVMTLIYSRHT